MGENEAKGRKGGDGEKKKDGGVKVNADPPKTTKNSSIININNNDDVIIDINNNNRFIVNINNNNIEKNGKVGDGKKTGADVSMDNDTKKPKENGKVGDRKKTGADFSKDNDTKKPKELSVSTVFLQIPINFDGCKGEIKQAISEITGVEKVRVHMAEGLVTVKGTVDSKSLPSLLEKKSKLKRFVVLVPTSKD